MPLEGLDKYKAAFCLLAEKGQDKIKVSKFIDFVKAAFGQTYDDDTMHVFSQGLRPDENGLVDFDVSTKLLQYTLAKKTIYIILYTSLCII